MKFQVSLSLLLLLVVPLLGVFLINKDLDHDWQVYKSQYSKIYEGYEEYSKRFIWEQNLKYIKAHNTRYDLGNHSYFLGINQFTDMTTEEFRDKYLRPLRSPTSRDSVRFLPPVNPGDLPIFLNWTAKGYVTPVKDQGQCKSSYAFSTTGVLEGQYFRKYKKLVSFSEQQLVDCSARYNNQGCNGGNVTNSYSYGVSYGFESETNYPYHGKAQNCQYDSSKMVNGSRLYGWRQYFTDTELSLMDDVSFAGPNSVVVDATNFQHYKGGIYDDPACSSTMVNHAVLVVGYDDRSSQHYWIVKNSWGTSWGVQGYILMSKDKNNQCGIALEPSFPFL